MESISYSPNTFPSKLDMKQISGDIKYVSADEYY